MSDLCRLAALEAEVKLWAEVKAARARIEALEAELGAARAHITAMEGDAARHEDRIAQLEAALKLATVISNNRIEALEAPHTDRHTPCPTCGHVITHVERKPIVVVDEGGEDE